MVKSKRNYPALILNTVMLVSLLLFHYSGASIAISTANPMSALALLVAIIMYSSEVTGVLTGVLLGVVLDSVTSTPIGFNTVTLTVISFAASLVSHYLFNRNLKSSLISLRAGSWALPFRAILKTVLYILSVTPCPARFIRPFSRRRFSILKSAYWRNAVNSFKDQNKGGDGIAFYKKATNVS